MLPNYVLEALLSPIVSFYTKIEWLDWNESVIGDFTPYVIDGNITVDVSRNSRRNFTLRLENTSGLFIPGGSYVNMKVKVRLKRGVLSSQGIYWWNKGVYVLCDPESIHNKAEVEVNLNGYDKWALLDGTLGGILTETYIIPNGTLVSEAIKSLAQLAGETKFNFDPCAATTPYEITKDPGTTIADIITELALIPSYQIFYDIDGFLRFKPIVDANTKPILYDFSTTGEFKDFYIGGTYKPEWSKIKNYWKVIGYHDTTTGVIYSGVAEDNNPNSPTNTSPPPTGIGKKAEILEDSNLTSNDLCTQRAQYELQQNLKRINRSSHTLIPCPFLVEEDCIQLEDTKNGIQKGKYEIQSIYEPFNQEMQIETWMVV